MDMYFTWEITDGLSECYCQKEEKVKEYTSEVGKGSGKSDGAEESNTQRCSIMVNIKKSSVDKKNQLDVTFCILYFSSNSCSTCFRQPCAHH
jgi:hypothetical protein